SDVAGGLIPVVDGLMATANQTLGSLGVTSLLPGAGLNSTSDVTNAVGSVTGLFNVVLGSTTSGLPLVDGVTKALDLNAIAPALNPTQTVDGLLKSLRDGDLIRIDLGVSSARNAGDLQSYISQAVSE